ncbi:hypothetical protein NON20_23450 [Synechocystis sp. B12]|jgi:hypothetical protein|uniref:hypothetical protein n=1 Tax=Synechocystis sp. CACIAM 05 TaxID=1933929 RepID=UPI00138E75EC|nr:hypothetical protein [Synechocystis sp. CACIAM 05]QHV01388.1 hypothetical protein BWK47_15455 [Synechocystis sp. CACIAM 05]WLT38363.1 hypothetical protein NON20_23450 [Synechocystis sp. B12]
MPVIDQEIQCQTSTLDTLMIGLRNDCQNTVILINQLLSSELTEHQKGDVLAEILVAAIHLQSHCDEDLQNIIFEKLENL